MSRLFDHPLPVLVTLGEDGEPVHLRWELEERVLEVCGRWRVDDDWWREPVSRAYYLLRTPTALLELFEDAAQGGWYLERVHD